MNYYRYKTELIGQKNKYHAVWTVFISLQQNTWHNQPKERGSLLLLTIFERLSLVCCFGSCGRQNSNSRIRYSPHGTLNTKKDRKNQGMPGSFKCTPYALTPSHSELKGSSASNSATGRHPHLSLMAFWGCSSKVQQVLKKFKDGRILFVLVMSRKVWCKHGNPETALKED